MLEGGSAESFSSRHRERSFRSSAEKMDAEAEVHIHTRHSQIDQSL